jgi:TonB family protein
MSTNENDNALSAPLLAFRRAVRTWSAQSHPMDRTFTVIPATDHLGRLLLPAALDVPWYRSLWSGMCDLFQPAPPPLDITSKPVLVRDIWGQFGRQKKSWVMSVGLQCAAVGLVFAAAVTPAVVKQVQGHVTLIAPVAELAPLPAAKPATVQPHGGGGGGTRDPLPASFGKPPKFSPMPFVPPAAVVPNLQAKLTMDPALLGPPDLKVPTVDVAVYGDPLSKFTIASNGPGTGGGIGTGHNGGDGPGNGPGLGPGSGGGTGGESFNGVFRGGIGGVTDPKLLVKVEPEYSDEARKAKYQGTVQLYVEVDASGRAQNIKVLHSLGLGLDEKAMDAVAKWKFRPGTKNGKAVTVMALIDVSFRLL